MSFKQKIFHDLHDINEGQEYILTLQDETILDEKGELKEDYEEVLLNQELYDKHKAEHKNFLKENARKLGDVKTAHMVEHYEKKLLPHYDEYKFEKDGIQLNEEGQFRIEQLKELERIQEKLKQKKGFISLNEEGGGELNNLVAKEYKEQKNQQIKIKKKIKKVKKQDKQSDNLLDFLEENFDENLQENNLKNAKQLKEGKKQENFVQQLTEQKVKRENFNQALQAAKNAQQEANKNWQKNIIEDEDEVEYLQKSVERMRNLQNKQKIMKLENLLEENEKFANNLNNNQEVFAVPKAKKTENTVNNNTQINAQELKEIIFSEDSLKHIDTEEAINLQKEYVFKPETKKSVKDTKKGTTSVVNVSMPTDRFKGKRHKDIIQEENDFKKMLEEENLTEEEIKLMQEELEKIGLYKEDLGVGLSGFVSELQERGILQDDNLVFSGRNKDLDPTEDGTITKENERIQLEYRDETGKIMTKKQAFRYLCWKFHGKGPSRNKLEKIKKKDLDREATLQHKLSEDSNIMKNLKQAQKITNQPFFVVQKKN